MTITTQNYQEVAKSINWAAVPESLLKTHRELIPDASHGDWAAYKSTPDVKRVIDKYFGYLTTIAERQGNAAIVQAPKRNPSPPQLPSVLPPEAYVKKPKAVKAKAQPAAKPAPKPKKAVAVKEEASHGKPVEHIANTVQFVKRYVSLNGKTKSAEDLSRLLHGVQKAILERRITKTSLWAKEIDHMQTSLRQAISQMDAVGNIKVEIKPALLKIYHGIAQSESAMPSVRLLKQYIGLTGKKGVKEKSRKLRDAMWKAVDSGKITDGDPYEAQLDKAYSSLCTFIDGRETSLDLHPYELNGLAGITGHAVTGRGTVELSGLQGASSSLFSSKKHQIELAIAFSKTLLKVLKPKLFAEMVAAHIKDDAASKSYCMSNDYCDANQVMVDAFRVVFNRKANVGMANNPNVQRDMKMIKAAWTLAKTNDFYAHPGKKKRKSVSGK